MLALYEAAPRRRARLDRPDLGAHRRRRGRHADFLATKRRADAALKRVRRAFRHPAPGRRRRPQRAWRLGAAARARRHPLANAARARRGADAVRRPRRRRGRRAATPSTGRIPPGSDLDTRRAETLHARAKPSRCIARWLGLPPARPIEIPGLAARAVAAAADLLGHLGWRSPLRSTALHAAAGGVVSSAAGRYAVRQAVEDAATKRCADAARRRPGCVVCAALPPEAGDPWRAFAVLARCRGSSRCSVSTGRPRIWHAAGVRARLAVAADAGDQPRRHRCSASPCWSAASPHRR